MFKPSRIYFWTTNGELQRSKKIKIVKKKLKTGKELTNFGRICRLKSHSTRNKSDQVYRLRKMVKMIQKSRM